MSEMSRLNRGEYSPEDETQNESFIKFYFGSHATESDAEAFKKFLDESDVLATEIPPAEAEQWNAVSRGDMLPKDFNNKKDIISGTFSSKVLEYLYGSGKLVLGLGEESNDIISLVKDYTIFLIHALINFYAGNFEESIANYSEASETDYLLQTRREAEFKRNIEQKLPPLVTGQKKQKVIVLLGAAHSLLFHDLDLKGLPATKEFQDGKPFIFSAGEEVLRRKRAGKEVSRDLLGKSLVVNVLSQYLDDFVDDSGKIDRFLRFVTMGWTAVEATNFSKALGKDHFLDAPEELGQQIIDNAYFTVTGIHLPKTENDVDRILST